MGCRIRLIHASRELQELLAFMGLSDAVPCEGLSVDPWRQSEEGEHPGGVQEEADP